MIGTNRAPISLSFIRSLNSRTVAIVVATCCLPDPARNSSYALSPGWASGLARTTRFGDAPPSAARRSFMYWISSDFSPGW
jgi:hypothetical protein